MRPANDRQSERDDGGVAAPGDLISTASGNVTVERVAFSVEKGIHGIGVPSGIFYADKVATSYFVDLGVSRRAWDRVLGYATLRHRIGAPMDKFLAYCHRDGLCLFDVDWFGTLCDRRSPAARGLAGERQEG